MEIIALQEYTDKYVSLYQGEIRNIEDSLANKLIAKKVVAEHSDSGSGDGSGVSGNNIIWIDYNNDDNFTYNNVVSWMREGKLIFVMETLYEGGASLHGYMVCGYDRYEYDNYSEYMVYCFSPTYTNTYAGPFMWFQSSGLNDKLLAQYAD